MKKHLFIISLTFIFSFSALSQSNIGIIIGGGVSDFRMRTDSIKLDNEDNKELFNFRPIYQAGFNFENVLIERKLYLQFGLYAKSSGFSSNSDSLGMIFHNIHIPLEIKYKHFFNKRGEGYVYGAAGGYFAASYRGIAYDQIQIDKFLDDKSGSIAMANPLIKIGKSNEDDIEAFDYGISAGFGYGYDKFQIGYNFGLGISNVIPKEWLEVPEGEDAEKFILRNSFHTITVGLYFSNK